MLEIARYIEPTLRARLATRPCGVWEKRGVTYRGPAGGEWPWQEPITGRRPGR